MQATLVIPTPNGVTQTYPLRLDYHEGKPVLVSSHGHIINGSYFQFLRDRMSANIETTELKVVSGILGLPAGEPGLVERG